MLYACKKYNAWPEIWLIDYRVCNRVTIEVYSPTQEPGAEWFDVCGEHSSTYTHTAVLRSIDNLYAKIRWNMKEGSMKLPIKRRDSVWNLSSPSLGIFSSFSSICIQIGLHPESFVHKFISYSITCKHDRERQKQEKGSEEQHVRLFAELSCQGFLTLTEVLPNLCVWSLTHASPCGSWDSKQITRQVCSILPSVWLLLNPVLPNPWPLPECKLQVQSSETY